MCFEDLDTDVRNQLFKKARETIQREFDKQHTGRTRKKPDLSIDNIKQKVFEILKQPVKGAVLAGQFSDYLQTMIAKHIT